MQVPPDKSQSQGVVSRFLVRMLGVDSYQESTVEKDLFGFRLRYAMAFVLARIALIPFKAIDKLKCSRLDHMCIL